MQFLSVNKCWPVLVGLLISFQVSSQERDQYQYWLELASADQTYADRSREIGRTRAFLEFLGEGSIVFRDSGPVDALEEYNSADFERDELTWESHYIDVSRDGDLGLTAGPSTAFNRAGEQTDVFGHLVSIWKKTNGRWELMADMLSFIPGFLSLEVEPDFEDTRPVFEETAHPVLALSEENTLQSLIDADNLFGRSINFRGGQRALLSLGLENARVYLPSMGPAVGVEVASSVYGAYLDNELSTTNPISLTYMGGYLSSSREMGYTYGTMVTNTDETEQGFGAAYLRLWRLNELNEWRIAVEVLRPINPFEIPEPSD
ncbi:MAG: nuclear transport factor 2 family protein [Proteobacteria bacterium]|nr:nuclear transport factor 2 family protein [Pseudomonadota bacterium]